MKTLRMIVLVLLVAGMVLPPAAFAQRGMRWKGSGGWGSGAPYGRMYDSKTVETVSGEVINLALLTPTKGMGQGIHLLLKTDKETIPVHLGPAWFIENQDLKIEKGDRIDVRGSRIMFQQKPAIIAAEVKKGSETLMLRDDNGFPVWSGWRRR
ncbi:MAG: DNA-binding protein [Nitrospirae bacterium]|nr:DNA-binding protein [Nitrospirota bacterium]